nr:hypothetical protein [uncultured Pedobacter sp.]
MNKLRYEQSGTDIVLVTNVTKIYLMNVKRTFGTILTVLGIIALIYAGYGYVQHSIQTRELIVVAIIGIIFFVSGIGLIKNTKDEA